MGNIFAQNWECQNKKCVQSAAGKEDWFQCQFKTCTAHNCSGRPNYACKPAGWFMKGTFPNATACQTACKSSKYACSGDPNYTCATSGTGTYATAESCQTACVAPPPPNWACDTSSGACLQTTDATPDGSNLFQCLANCHKSGQYACSGDPYYACAISDAGSYANYSACSTSCHPPAGIKYACNSSDMTCSTSAAGTYATYNDCYMDCGPRVLPMHVTPYACSGAPDYACTASKSGTYANYNDCRLGCKMPPPTTRSRISARDSDHPFRSGVQSSEYRGVVYSQYIL